MKTFFLFLAIIYTTVCYAGSSVTIPADNKLIEYTGRIDFLNAKAPRFSYSGVSIRACFNGTSISAIMDDNVGKNFYNIFLDGILQDTINVRVGKKVYKLAEGLKNTNHEIEIFKRTEEQFGKTQFLGFILDKGASLTKISFQKDKLIEYIGNSITCGYGNEGHNGETFGPTTENHYLTYAAITSRFFNARHLAVCKSGIGVYRNYDGPATGSADCMANIYTRVFLKDKNPKYSFSQKPDLVCIDLGTNDFSTQGGDSARFVSAYLRLIDTIQTKNEKADIICLLGPMLSEPTLSNVRGYIKNVVKLANQKGNGNVYFFEMSQQTGNPGIDGHPNVAQHEKNAYELIPYITKLKGWRPNTVIVGYGTQKKLQWTN